jgi:cardiolipin synthase
MQDIIAPLKLFCIQPEVRMRMRLLVDSKEFWAVLREDIQSAQHSIYIQTFSFEGDQTGKMLAEALISSPARDKRIIVDDYTRWVISDKYLYSPRNLFDVRLRQEVRETYRMIENLERNGVIVQFSSPGSVLEKFAIHNHKKVVLIDSRIAYIGGINFCEHNFVWHDAMLRIEDAVIAEALYTDFQTTWAGVKSETSQNSDAMELYCLSGYSNHLIFGRILDMIDGAKERIYIESPYITFPFLDRLKEAGQRGCAVTLITPGPNNYPLLREYILWESNRSKLDVRLYKRMTHLKAMLIDQRYLIFGSSNYDYLSYQFHDEIVAIITNPELISEFEARIFQEDIRNSEPGYRVSHVKGSLINIGMRTSARLLSVLLRSRSRPKPYTSATLSPANGTQPVLPKSRQ